MSQACGCCGAGPHEMFDGYPPPADVKTLLEEFPPPLLIAFVARLRELTHGSAHLQLHVHIHQGEQEWEFIPNLKVRRKKAS